MPKRKTQIQQAQIVSRFATKLRELRLTRGMTQTELGKAAHVTGSYVGRLEAGATSPGIDLLERLAIALGTTTNDLLPPSNGTTSSDSLPILQSRARTHSTSCLSPLIERLYLCLFPC